jgi:hypothetical protein
VFLFSELSIFLGGLLKTLKKVDPMSAARMAAIAGIIWGLAVGVLMILNVGAEMYMGRLYRGYHTIIPSIGVPEIIALPIAYGITGYIGAYIGALLYNLVAKQFGGIKVDLK